MKDLNNSVFAESFKNQTSIKQDNSESNKYGEFPRGFEASFMVGYRKFWEKRNMPVPDTNWKRKRP
jgi:hypothetical protein